MLPGCHYTSTLVFHVGYANRLTSIITKSHVIMAINLYSTLAEDLETTSCFFDLQEIKASPKNTPYPVKNFLVLGQPAQSAS